MLVFTSFFNFYFNFDNVCKYYHGEIIKVERNELLLYIFQPKRFLAIPQKIFLLFQSTEGINS